MKVLMFGPLPPPFHGQSLAFKKFLEINFEGYVIDINLTKFLFVKKLYLNILILFKTIKYIFILKDEDVVYFTCSRSFLGSVRDINLLILSRLKGMRVICHLHGADFKTFYEGANVFYQKLVNFAYQNVDTFVVLSAAMVDQFDMFPDKKVVVINNFYPSELDDYPMTRRCSARNKKLQLLYLSNLMKSKGIIDLLDAYEKTSNHSANIELIIAGDFIDDYEMSAVELEHIVRKKLSRLKGVKHVGVVSGQEKLDLLVESDVFILPTYHRSEAVPLSIFEAMAAGCAIISTQHNFIPDIVCDKGSMLVPVNDIDSLSKAILLFSESAETLYSQKVNNIKFAEQNYHEGLYKEKLKSLIEHGYI